MEALDEALARWGSPEIFNSDQGSQFTSRDVHGSVGGARHSSEHGRPRPRVGQRVHRAAVAKREV